MTALDQTEEIITALRINKTSFKWRYTILLMLGCFGFGDCTGLWFESLNQEFMHHLYLCPLGENELQKLAFIHTACWIENVSYVWSIRLDLPEDCHHTKVYISHHTALQLLLRVLSNGMINRQRHLSFLFTLRFVNRWLKGFIIKGVIRNNLPVAHSPGSFH